MSEGSTEKSQLNIYVSEKYCLSKWFQTTENVNFFMSFISFPFSNTLKLSVMFLMSDTPPTYIQDELLSKKVCSKYKLSATVCYVIVH
jgi:hypothetical protein